MFLPLGLLKDSSGKSYERNELLNEFKGYLGVNGLSDLKIIDVYDLIGLKDEQQKKDIKNMLLEPLTEIYSEEFKIEDGEVAFRVKDLKGQFNKREYFTNQLIKNMFPEDSIDVKTSKIILLKGINKEEFERMFGNDFINILSNDETSTYAHGYIDSEYLKNNIELMDGYFYVCGPRPMMKAVEQALEELGVEKEKIVKEVF